MKKTSIGIMVTLLLSSMLMVAFNIQAAVLSELPETEWERTYGGTNDERGQDIVQTSDGGYVIVGWMESVSAGGKDFWLVKTDADGNMEWNQTYGGPDDDIGLSVIQTSDEGYAIAGVTWLSGTQRDIWLVKADADGNMEWNQTYGYTSTDEVVVARSGVVQTVDGYAFAGWTGALNGPSDFWLVKTDSTGNHEWNKTYDNRHIDRGEAFAKTSDDGYAIAGMTGPGGLGRDVWLVKTNSTGDHEWNRTYGGADNDYAHFVVPTSDGGYAIAGYTNSFGAADFDFWLIKLAPEEISATVDIDPDTLNLKSNGQWITAYIELSEEYSVSEIDVSSILLNGSISVDPEAPTEVGDHDMDSIPDLMVKFERATIIEWLGTADYSEDTGKYVEVTLEITGEVAGTPFEGVDTVRVLLKG